MKYITAPATVLVSPCLSPVQVWQQLLGYLLEHHYGLTLNDTPFHDEAAIQEHIYEQTLFLTATDILRAKRATGLMNT